MTQNKAQRPTKAREFTPHDASETSAGKPDNTALLQAILEELRAIRARLEPNDDLANQIARGVRRAMIGGGNHALDDTSKRG